MKIHLVDAEFFHGDRRMGRFEDVSGSSSSSLLDYLESKISYVFHEAI
jgi:hypothetical protein